MVSTKTHSSIWGMNAFHVSGTGLKAEDTEVNNKAMSLLFKGVTECETKR